MARQSAYSFQDEVIFIRGLGSWSKDANKQPRGELIAGYVRGMRRREIGFDSDLPPTREQLVLINTEVLALCRRLGVDVTLSLAASLQTTH